LEEAVGTQEVVTLELGQASADREGKEFELNRNRELYDQIMRRRRDLEMEMDLTPRVRVQYWADVADIEDKRGKYSAAVIFLALGCGVGLAVIRDRMDKTLQTLDDLSREIDLPVIGTTTSSRTVKPAAFAEHLAGDYQTIRTNLALLTSGGMPKKLAVSSPGMREGKTTFAVNLATSLAKAGKKVLLIDGDLRKPDIASMLSILNGSVGLQDVLLGGDFSKAIHVVSASGLHVLAASARNPIDADRGYAAGAGVPGRPGVGQAYGRRCPGQLCRSDDRAGLEGGQGAFHSHSGARPRCRVEQRAGRTQSEPQPL
jgi:hypothetical protein